MTDLILFTDGSVNPQTNIGYGAYLTVPEEGLSLDSLKLSVKVKRFERTSSTKLELQTLHGFSKHHRFTGKTWPV